ncbi:winged helix-turn-helix domain-containing protein [Thalassotalea fusca]
MLYQFQNFEFNSESLVLTQNGEPVAIRHNEAKVLLALIENLDKVLSKDDILSMVWQEKIVSDQAVFQNISHLRNIIGTSAIKTFPKRGYQWQLHITSVAQQTPPSAPSLTLDKEDTKVSPESIATSPKLLLSIAVFLVVFIVLVFMSKNAFESDSTESEIVRIGYIPFSLTVADTRSTIRLDDSESIDIATLENLTTSAFAAAQELEYRAISAEYPLVLTGTAYFFEQNYHLDFVLKGPVRQWQGQLTDDSLPSLLEQLHHHLAQPFIRKIVSEPRSPELLQASLSIAHQQSPDDLIVLGQLIDSYIKLGEYEKAMTLADKLLGNAQAQQNIQQQGVAFLYQSRVLTQKQLFELSEVKLITAKEKFTQVNDLARLIDSFHAHSWINHQFNDYEAIKDNLTRAAMLALEIQDIERELHALTYLSVMAHKHRKTEDKYTFLTKAEQKMTAYQLPIYRFAKIPFHHAIYTDSKDGKEPHLRRVLEYTELTPDHWVAQSSREQLMQYYIDKGRLRDAQQLLSQAVTVNADNAYLKALYARASKQQTEFIRYAKEAFELAQLAGINSISLDAALMLCSNPDTQTDFDFYSQFISENATANWRKNNQNVLASLSLIEQ